MKAFVLLCTIPESSWEAQETDANHSIPPKASFAIEESLYGISSTLL